MTKQKFLTLGQAACIVNNVSQSDANKKKCKVDFYKSEYNVCYNRELGLLEPIIMKKEVISINTHKYGRYVDSDEDKESNQIGPFVDSGIFYH